MVTYAKRKTLVSLFTILPLFSRCHLDNIIEKNESKSENEERRKKIYYDDDQLIIVVQNDITT